MRSLSLALLLASWLFVPLSSTAQDATAAAQSPSVDAVAPIVAVTLYSDQARVTRRLVAPAVAGVHTLSVGPLPPHIDRQSLQASASSGVRVVSVQIAESSGTDRASDAYLAAEAALKETELRLAQGRRRLDIISERFRSYRELEVGAPPRSSAEPQTPPIEPRSWRSYLSLIEQGMRAAWSEAATVEAQVAELEREFERQQRALNELRPTRRRDSVTVAVVVRRDESAGAAATVDLSYRLGGARWYPSYQMEVSENAAQLRIDRFAVVEQRTGEAWPAVPLSFSTGVPESGAGLPELVAIHIERPRFADDTRALGLVAEAEAPEIAMAPAENRRARKRGKMSAPAAAAPAPAREAVQRRSFDRYSSDSRKRADFLAPKLALDEAGSGGGSGYAEMEEDDEDGFARRFRPVDNARGFLTVFESTHAAAVASDGAPHRLPLGALHLDTREERLLVPELQKQVYRQLVATLAGADPLLAGSAAVFVAGDYLGELTLQTTGPGEELRLDLGIDDAFRIERHLVESEEETGFFTSGTRYRTRVELTIESFHTAAVTLRIDARIPFSDQEEVQVALGKCTPRPKRHQKHAGLLEWNLRAAPGENRVSYNYTIDTPADFQLRRWENPGRRDETGGR